MAVQDLHLRRRGNVYYLHRRVPLDLVKRYGKSLISCSLGTADLKLARKRRDLENLKLNAQFEKLRSVPTAKPLSTKTLSIPAITGLVQDYVASTDADDQHKSLVEAGPTSEEAYLVRQELEIGRSILKDGKDPNGLQWIYSEGSKILGHPPGALELNSLLPFLEIVRRGLLELQDRKLLRLESDFSRPFVNPMFGPTAQAPVTFGEVAEQYLATVVEEGRANDTNEKWIDKQRANVALLKEIVGEDTPIRDVEYSACMAVRTALGGIPANWKKSYEDLDLEAALHATRERGLPTMTLYVSALTSVRWLKNTRYILSGQMRAISSSETTLFAIAPPSLSL